MIQRLLFIVKHDNVENVWPEEHTNQTKLANNVSKPNKVVSQNVRISINNMAVFLKDAFDSFCLK